MNRKIVGAGLLAAALVAAYPPWVADTSVPGSQMAGRRAFVWDAWQPAGFNVRHVHWSQLAAELAAIVFATAGAASLAGGGADRRG